MSSQEPQELPEIQRCVIIFVHIPVQSPVHSPVQSPESSFYTVPSLCVGEVDPVLMSLIQREHVFTT